VQVVVLSGFAGLVGLHVLKQLGDVRGAALAAAAVAVAAGFGVAYRRVRSVGAWARFAAVGPVLFLVVFLALSPTSSLVFPSDARAAEVGGARLPRHIVMILFDELPTQSLLGRDGLVDGERFPNFARFADESTWYRNHTSVSGSTEFAVPALLTGRYPRDVLATAASHPQNLFTLLGGSYDVHADEVITALCPQSVCRERSAGATALRKVAGDAIDVWREQMSLSGSDRPAVAGFVEETTRVDDPEFDAFEVLHRNAATSPARLRAWLDHLPSGDRPTVEFLHLLLPHQPWHFYPSGVEYPYPAKEPGRPDVLTSGRWGAGRRPAELGRQRHLAQVGYVDRLLGRVLATLRARSLYDESLVVVTADHGAAFRPGEEVRPGLESDAFPARSFEQVMWAPLMIKAPHQRTGRINDANVESIDLLPTLADEIGVRIPWAVDGRPADRRGRSADKTFFTTKLTAFEDVALAARTTVDGRHGLVRMLAGNARAFAPDPDPAWALARAGPYGAVIGRPLRRLPVGPPSALPVVLDTPGAYTSVDPASGSVPGLVLGGVTADAPATVAVAVNGRLAGVSPTFSDDAGPRRFGVLVPDHLFRRGRNDVRVFEAGPPGAAFGLRPVAVPGLG
jgi:arylsulfatase A-like enzyme